MKKILFLLAFTAVIGCKKEDTTPIKENEFTLDSKSFKLDQAWIENWGMQDGIYNNDLTLVSSTISPLLDEDGILEYYSGKGNLIYLEMYTRIPNSFEVGTYQFSDSFETNTFDMGIVLAGYNFDEEDGEGQYLEVVDGTVKVIAITEKNIEVEVNLKTDDGNNLKGYFKGATKLYDYTSEAQARIKNSLVKKSKKPRFKL
ncbi:MAG: hypothetical protein IPH28_09065 [Cytophagaceae bacterium]|nr:hypothetical protein [Cytophagaceae bacterium]MBK9510311.1 hypothetical protein [Cytophagaceae bacterium]MBK9933117.1 hypothetical protein [Cytophagaceae bacterium]MBL0303166.1 hypothetical protein [Cytophagaceae bacterium]MBL0326013.1 hypothetical protein [Cytophagaceae bacterium]